MSLMGWGTVDEGRANHNATPLLQNTYLMGDTKADSWRS